MSESFLNGRVTLYAGDCRDVLGRIPENSIDSVVCDPPYSLVSIQKRFGNATPEDVYKNAELRKNFNQGTSPHARAARGFMGKKWDTGEVAFDPNFWAEVWRVLKPGAHLLAMGGTRTYHHLAMAIEQAGFEIRDQLAWTYGSGFPKSHDVSKGIDKAAGAEREVIGRRPNVHSRGQHKLNDGWRRPWMEDEEAIARSMQLTAPATEEAAQWQGWGTALKPAWEPICLARKSLSEKTVAANVLRWGTGALNIDGCRVATGESLNGGAYSGALRQRDERTSTDSVEGAVPLSRFNRGVGDYKQPLGRWPANLVHDGSEEVLQAFPDSQGQQGDVRGTEPSSPFKDVYGTINRAGSAMAARGDSGSAARFFYTAKADADDRLGSKHPTVKPVDLMQWLVRLVTPKGGTCLDPFAGTGTTGEAAWREGMFAILIEREAEYQDDIRRRMALALAGPDERARETLKASGKADMEPGPLFGGIV